MAEKGPAFIGKIVILTLGVLILGVGLHSHFKSAWTYKESGMHTYEICSLENIKEGLKIIGKSCPAISLELYFVSMVIICFILSLVITIAGFVVDLSSLKLVDAGYHVIAAVLLFIAAITYMVSASQIKSIFDLIPEADAMLEETGIKFLSGEKYAAGALTIIQSVLYAVVGFLIFKS